MACLALLVLAAPASAEFGFSDLSVTFEDESGAPVTEAEAGAHPFAMTTAFDFNVKIVPDAAKNPNPPHELIDGELPDEELKDLTAYQERGLIGSQVAVPPCKLTDFADRSESYPACSDKSAVGYVSVKANFDANPVGVPLDKAWHVPLYSLEPAPGAAATFGFIPGNVPIVFNVVVSEKDPHNLIVQLPDGPQALLIYGSEVTIWGNPASSAHDELRGKCVGEPAVATTEPVSKGFCPVTLPEVPLLTLPRSCKGPLQSVFEITSWQGGFDEGIADSGEATDCGSLEFDPEASADPETSAASTPTGLDFGIDVEDEGLTDPAKRAKADVAAVTATLPAGVTANPSAAEGQGVCTEAQFGIASLSQRGCPGDSKLGTVQVASPLLEKELEGSIYLAEPHKNPFGSLLATYLVIRNEEYGIFVKQAGEIHADRQTGQLTTRFEDLPELPFSSLRVKFRQGPRAPLATPPRCGTYTTETLFTPSSGNAPVRSSSSFDVTSGPDGSPCPTSTPFHPAFLAGSLSNTAGSYSPFYLRLTRSDGEGQITRIDAVLPPGVVGKLAGLGRCSDAEIGTAQSKTGKAELASPSCPSSSRVGRILAGAGVGPSLTHVPGSLYLAGPYGGHPLSVVAIVPAVAGPFDLGTVVVRSGLDLDPTTAQVVVDGTAAPIPKILEGIPLQLRDLELIVDRPEFTLNPTSCDEEQATATLFSDTLSAALAQRYQAADCSALGFKPKLTLTLKGQMKRSGNPALRSTLVPRPGNANIGAATVILPPSEFISNAHINSPCTRVQFNANQCPPTSVLGTARAFSPLLDQPLEGPVYFRSNGGERELPDIVADLHGQFRIILVGFVDSRKGRLRTRFLSVPDAPVSKFELSLFGGKRGLLENSRNLCASSGKLHTELDLIGQNGKRHDTQPVLKTSCKGRKKQR
jgi:hypothetical protein